MFTAETQRRRGKNGSAKDAKEREGRALLALLRAPSRDFADEYSAPPPLRLRVSAVNLPSKCRRKKRSLPPWQGRLLRVSWPKLEPGPKRLEVSYCPSLDRAGVVPRRRRKGLTSSCPWSWTSCSRSSSQTTSWQSSSSLPWRLFLLSMWHNLRSAKN